MLKHICAVCICLYEISSFSAPEASFLKNVLNKIIILNVWSLHLWRMSLTKSSFCVSKASLLKDVLTKIIILSFLWTLAPQLHFIWICWLPNINLCLRARIFKPCARFAQGSRKAWQIRARRRHLWQMCTLSDSDASFLKDALH